MKTKELKKYKILVDFGNYKKGELVEFYADDDYTDKLISSKKIASLDKVFGKAKAK